MNHDANGLKRRHSLRIPAVDVQGGASRLSVDASSDLSTSSDAALVKGIVARHEPALAEIYDRHAAALYGLALRVLRAADHAEEVLQETLCTLWEHPDRFDATRGDLRPWLLRVVHGKAVDRVRSEARRSAREEREAALEPPRRDDIEREVWEMIRAETIRSALETLAEGEREAIELAYFGGYTYREVATLLHQPEGTVKSRIRLGLARLADRLATAGLDPNSDRSTT